MIRMAVAALWLMAPAASAQEPARVDPVVVTATKVETPASRVGASVTVITEEELETYNYERIEDVPADVGMHLYHVATQLIPVIQDVTGIRDMNIVINSGVAAGQDVFHFHVHLIPRRPDDGFDVPLPFAASEMPDRTRLDALAARIISTLRDPMRGSVGRR